MGRIMRNPTATLSKKIWPIAEAKARLSEILRLAEKEGPQQVGLKNTFVIVSKEDWSPSAPPPMSLGEGIIKFMPRGTNLEIPSRKEGGERKIPFIDYATE